MEKINLASGAAYFITPQPIREAAIAALEAGQTSYGPNEGTLALRQAIAGRYERLNQALVSPDRILVTAGVKEAIYIICIHLLQPNDEVIVPIPNWFGFQELLVQAKANMVFLPTAADSDYTLTPEALAAAITPRTKMVILCNPCNPTGRIYTRAELAALLAVLDHYPAIWVLSDEIYDLVTYGERIPSLTEFPDTYQRYLTVNGYSKSFAMSGWRIGYLIAPPEVYQACSKFQATTIGGVSPFIQAGAAVATAQAEAILAPMNRILAENRTFICDQLAAMSTIPFFMPQAAYYVFANLSHYVNILSKSGKGNGTDTALCDYLQQSAGIELYPGEYFGAPGFARICFAVQRAQLQQSVPRLQEALQALQ